MGRRDTSLPNKHAIHSIRLAFLVCGVLSLILGIARLYAGEFAYPTRFGLASTLSLILLGLFFVALAIFWHPRPHGRNDRHGGF